MALTVEIKSEPLDTEKCTQDLEDELDAECFEDPNINNYEEIQTENKSENDTYHLLGKKQLYVDLTDSNVFEGYDHTVGSCNKSSEDNIVQDINYANIKTEILAEIITEETDNNYNHLLGKKQMYVDLTNSNIINGHDQTAGICNITPVSSTFETKMGHALHVELINWDFTDRLDEMKQENLDLLLSSNIWDDCNMEEMLECKISVKKEPPFQTFESDEFENFYEKHIGKNIDELLECKIEEADEKVIENNVKKKKKYEYYKQRSVKKVVNKKKETSSYVNNYSVITPIINHRYQCHICQRNFAEKQTLKDHKVLHIPKGKNVEGRMMYNCAFCPYKPNYISHLRNHTKVQHTPQDELEIFACKTCAYKTPDMNSMRSHINTHKDPSKCEKFKCDQCSFETRYKCGLSSHKSRLHGEKETIFKCHQCTYQTHVQSYLKAHIKLKHKPLEEKFFYKCNDCAYKTTIKASLPAHMVMHKRQDEIKWWKCPECPFQTKHKGNLSKHHLVKHEVSEEATRFRTHLKCPHCDFRSYHKNHISRHIMIHKSKDEINWLQCEKCSFKAKDRSALDRHHYNRHTSADKIKWFSCNICSFKTKCKARVKIHELIHKSIHELSEIYACHLCIYETKTKTALQSHLERHKSLPEVKTFDCPKCTYKTRYSGHLKIHMLVHNPEKFEVVKCKDCPYKTRNKFTMQRHILRMHNNERAVWFKCDECSFKSMNKKSLKFHLLHHKKSVDVEWFKCAHCSYKTKYKNHLIGHFKIHDHTFEF